MASGPSFENAILVCVPTSSLAPAAPDRIRERQAGFVVQCSWAPERIDPLRELR